ncbi:Bbp19 family protein [Basilea psittacipulmonis]|uniref:Bbp19 family protein n=1 Tax=Basilea psittacipulmonis TaxID=1472345 RepID=UPI00068FAD5A|nr:hypothetical protein [Basilea psittacipulmonis]
MENKDVNYQHDELEVLKEQEDIEWLMSHLQGRRIVWRLLERMGVFRLSFNENPLHMSFLEGQRNEGLRLLNLVMEHCQESYFAMTRENGVKDGRRHITGY